MPDRLVSIETVGLGSWAGRVGSELLELVVLCVLPGIQIDMPYRRPDAWVVPKTIT